jgi:hypothetical protein
MNTRRKRVSKRLPARPEKQTPTADSPDPSSGQKSSQLAGARSALDECVGALCLVEVAMHSLEWQEIAFPEQEVLKRALKSIWSVHEWIDELRPDDLDDQADGEDES